MRTFAIGLGYALLATTPCLAQDIVGTSVVKGRTVELRSDYTWRYKDQTGSACRTVKTPVTFCGEAAGWKYSSSTNTDASAVFEHDDSNYGEFIVEHIGAKNGNTMDTMRSIVLSNAATFGGVKSEEVATLGDDAVTVDGVPGETIIYRVSMNKLQFVFYNTIVITPADTAQIVTFAVGSDVTDDGRHLHQQFLDQTHLK